MGEYLDVPHPSVELIPIPNTVRFGARRRTLDGPLW